MKRLLVALALVALATPAGAANLATPTATAAAATPAATPTADESARTDQQTKALGGERLERAVTFEGGLQVGSTANSASKLTFIQRGECLVDVAALTAASGTTGVPGVSKVTCAAPGVAAADTVLVEGLHPYDTGTSVYEALSVSRCQALATDELTCWLHYGGLATPGLDPGPMTIRYVVVR
jgi:hypothetical protein